MMKVSPKTTVVGNTTDGASAIPQPFEFSNGWKYFVSTWQAATTEFELIEDQGISPDVKVDVITPSNCSELRTVVFTSSSEVVICHKFCHCK